MGKRLIWSWALALMFWGGGVQGAARADEPTEAEAADPPENDKPANANVRTKTLGGRQFWGDVCFLRGWRIQQNVLTQHYRLLDPKDNRYAWGTLAECRDALEDARVREQLAPMSGTAVVLVHGIGRSSKSMRRMREKLEEAGYLVVGFNYPSTRVELSKSAHYLHQVVQSLEGVERIHFVGFSMGGLVLRSYFEEHQDPRAGRLVFVGTPNLGADLATALHKNWAYRLLLGPAGQQLPTGPDGAGAQLAIPEREFAVIAGHRGLDGGWNPLIPGDDDGTVSVDCTRLPGAVDFTLVYASHTMLVGHSDTIECVQRFLEQGRLRADGELRPIAREIPETEQK